MYFLDKFRFKKRNTANASSDINLNPPTNQASEEPHISFDELVARHARRNPQPSSGNAANSEKDDEISRWRDFASGRIKQDPKLDPLRTIAAQVFEQIHGLAKEMNIDREDFFVREWYQRAQHQNVSAEDCLGRGIPWNQIMQEMRMHANQAQLELAQLYTDQMVALERDYRHLQFSREQARGHERDIGFDR